VRHHRHAVVRAAVEARAWGARMKLRVRFYLDDQLLSEDWVCDGELGKLSERHAQETLKSPGKEWSVEIFDPDAPENEAYLRFGSTPVGMRWPIELDLTRFQGS
jgi:hypothetical protein